MIVMIIIMMVVLVVEMVVMIMYVMIKTNELIHCCLAVGLGHVDADARAKERQRVHYS